MPIKLTSDYTRNERYMLINYSFFSFNMEPTSRAFGGKRPASPLQLQCHLELLSLICLWVHQHLHNLNAVMLCNGVLLLGCRNRYSTDGTSLEEYFHKKSKATKRRYI